MEQSRSKEHGGGSSSADQIPIKRSRRQTFLIISVGGNQRELPSDSTLIIVALSFYRLTYLLSHSMSARAIIVFLVVNVSRVWLMFNYRLSNRKTYAGLL